MFDCPGNRSKRSCHSRIKEGISPGRQEAVAAAKEHHHCNRAYDEEVRELSQEKDGKFDATIFGIETAYQFAFSFRQIKRDTVDFCAGPRYINAEKYKSAYAQYERRKEREHAFRIGCSQDRGRITRACKSRFYPFAQTSQGAAAKNVPVEETALLLLRNFHNVQRPG